jgi:hypothetical protein
VVKKKSRASASRVKGKKKGPSKGARKSAVKRAKAGAKATLAGQEPREGLDVKKLQGDLDRAIDHLKLRIAEGDTNDKLLPTIDLFGQWKREILATVCIPVGGGSCGDDMFIGS